jgi:hypothetical protein
MKKSVKLECHVANSNIAIGSLPTLQMSHGLLALFEKIYYGGPIFTDFSNIGEDIQYRCFKVYDGEKCVAARHYAVICKQLLISNDRNRVRCCFRLL